MIVDSHCHLDYSSLYNQLDDVIKRAEYNQVKYLLTICTTLKSFETIKLITDKYENIYGTFGIHPHETKKFVHVDKTFILNSKKDNNKIIGIGETGLDFYYNFSEKNIQRKSFIEHINAALELNIPIIVHTREAENDTYEILKSEKASIARDYLKKRNLSKEEVSIEVEHLKHSETYPKFNAKLDTKKLILGANGFHFFIPDSDNDVVIKYP